MSDTPRWGEASDLPRYQARELFQQGRSTIGAILRASTQGRSEVLLKGLSNPVTIAQINSRAVDD